MGKLLKKYWPIFVLPTFLAFILGFIVPFVLGIGLSFTDFTTVVDFEFRGFENYIIALKDPTFVYSFWFTAAFSIISIVIINLFAFILAYILTNKIPGTNIFRTIFFMPNLVGGIVLGYIWSLLFDGVLAQFDTALKVSEEYGFWGLVIVVAWQQIGYMMIIYIAGLQNIPGSLNEAAKIDGANKWQTLKSITIPMMMPTITITTFLTMINSFKLFDQNLSLTAGEPASMTEMLALNIFNSFYLRTGYEGVGQAKAVIFFILVATLGIVQTYFTRKNEVEI